MASADYILGIDALSCEIVGAGQAASVKDASSAAARAASVSSKIARKLPKVSRRLSAISAKMNKAAQSAKAKKDSARTTGKTLPPSAKAAVTPTPTLSDFAARTTIAPSVSPTRASMLAVPAPTRAQMTSTVVAPTAKPPLSKATRVHGAVGPSELYSSAAPELVASVQEIGAVWAMSGMGEALSPVPDLVTKLNAQAQQFSASSALSNLASSTQALAQKGQDLINSANTLSDAYDSTDLVTVKSQADGIASSAAGWISSAKSSLSAAVPTATSAPGGAADGGGGGGGGGGDSGGGGGADELDAQQGGGEGGGDEDFAPEGEESYSELSDEGQYAEVGPEVPEEGFAFSADEGVVETAEPEAPQDEESTSTVTADVEEPTEAPAEDVSGDPPFTLKSELPGVSDKAWTKFACAMKTAPVGAVSKSNALGMYELRPRRLADLDIVMGVQQARTKPTKDCPNGRMVWVGEFVPPMTAAKFLRDPRAQYAAFARSMRNFIDGMKKGKVPTPEGGRPKDMTLSGALAVLHKCGPSGIKTWNSSDRFPETERLYKRINGIF